MKQSVFMALMFFTVSIKSSPFSTLLIFFEILTVSVLRRFAAISKDSLVLVLGSKKRLATVLPLRVGTFLMGLSRISLNAAAWASISSICSFSKCLIPKRCLISRGSPCCCQKKGLPFGEACKLKHPLCGWKKHDHK